jgi:hypothetical protein
MDRGGCVNDYGRPSLVAQRKGAVKKDGSDRRRQRLNISQEICGRQKMEVDLFCGEQVPTVQDVSRHLIQFDVGMLRDQRNFPSFPLAVSTSFISTRWFEILADGVSGTDALLSFESPPGNGL